MARFRRLWRADVPVRRLLRQSRYVLKCHSGVGGYILHRNPDSAGATSSSPTIHERGFTPGPFHVPIPEQALVRMFHGGTKKPTYHTRWKEHNIEEDAFHAFTLAWGYPIWKDHRKTNQSLVPAARHARGMAALTSFRGLVPPSRSAPSEQCRFTEFPSYALQASLLYSKSDL